MNDILNEIFDYNQSPMLALYQKLRVSSPLFKKQGFKEFCESIKSFKEELGASFELDYFEKLANSTKIFAYRVVSSFQELLPLIVELDLEQEQIRLYHATWSFTNGQLYCKPLLGTAQGNLSRFENIENYLTKLERTRKPQTINWLLDDIFIHDVATENFRYVGQSELLKACGELATQSEKNSQKITSGDSIWIVQSTKESENDKKSFLIYRYTKEMSLTDVYIIDEFDQKMNYYK
ncbi:MAG: hypothetical protein ACRCUP_07950 [Mycoplasmatales bacterium]